MLVGEVREDSALKIFGSFNEMGCNNLFDRELDKKGEGRKGRWRKWEV